MPKVDGHEISNWLRSETPGNLELLTKLRKRLVASMDTQYEDDGGIRPPDTNKSGTMNRDWCRGLERYQAGLHALLAEERERAKLKLLAHRAGITVLSDAEYESEIIDLGKEAVRELSTQDLAAEFMRRGMSMPVAGGSEDDPDA